MNYRAFITLVTLFATSIAPMTGIAKQGGDSWLDAFPVNSLPFEDAGSTVGYSWDAVWSSEACGGWLFQGPDVFYSLIVDHDTYLDIDLCGSPSAETRLWMLNSDFQDVDCVDNEVCVYYSSPSPCGFPSSRLAHVPVTGGVLYYIMVGHWFTGGEYTISIREDNGWSVPCPPGGEDEGEPEIAYGYIDNYNSGCSSLTPPGAIQNVDLGAELELTLCGNSGWPFFSHPDTDWFAVLSASAGTVEIALESDRPAYVMHLSPPDCLSYVVQEWGLARFEEIAEINMLVEAGVPAWIVIRPRSCVSDFSPSMGSFNYVLRFRRPAVKATTATWGTVKSLFRDGTR